MRYLYLIVFISFFLSCSSTQNSEQKKGFEKNEIIRIGWYKVPASRDESRMAMVFQDSSRFGTDDWQVFFNQISGFEFEPGYLYELEVSKEKKDKPNMDDPALIYTLVKEIHKEKIAAERPFYFFLHKKDLKFDGTDFFIHDMPFDCGISCNVIKEKAESGVQIKCRWNDDYSGYVLID